MSKPKDELKYQSYIQKSYKADGGFCRRWATEWTAGNPDLIATLPEVGLHLVEVKHWPGDLKRWTGRNLLTPVQQHLCRQYQAGGALVFVFVVTGPADDVKATALVGFDPALPTWTLDTAPWAGYDVGRGYPVRSLVERLMWLHNTERYND